MRGILRTVLREMCSSRAISLIDRSRTKYLRNITLLPLPPRSPELDPVENVWQFMHDNCLSNQVFTGHDAIVAHCCTACNDLIDQHWRVRSIGRRSGAEGLINASWCKKA